MDSAISRMMIYIVIIALSAFAKSRHRFLKRDSYFLGVLIVTFTLPATLIHNQVFLSFNLTALLLFLLGVLSNILMLFVGYRIHPKRNPRTSAIMLSLASYNIGGFLMPFVQLFYPGIGVVYISCMDFGNAIMGLGMNFVAAKAVSNPRIKVDARFIRKTLLASMPLMTYCLLVLLSLFRIPIPKAVDEVAALVASANPFVSMVMIGLLLEWRMPKKAWAEIGKVFSLRVLINTILALIVFFLFPMPLLARVIAIVCLGSPVATVSLVFSQRCGYKGDLTGMISAASILFSLAVSLVVFFIVN